MDKTKVTLEKPISKEKFNQLLAEILDKQLDQFQILLNEMKKSFEKDNNIILTKGLVYEKRAKILRPDFRTPLGEKMWAEENQDTFKISKFLKSHKLYSNAPQMFPPIGWVKERERVWDTVFGNIGILSNNKNTQRLLIYRNGCIYDYYDEWNTWSGEFIAFPICDYRGKHITDFGEFIEEICFEAGTCPTDLSEESQKLFSDYCALKSKGYAHIVNKKIDFAVGALLNALVSGKDKNMFKNLHTDLLRVLEEYLELRRIGEDMKPKEELLNCEKIRADIEPYEERILTDPNRGHWDLWMDDGTECYTVKMDDAYMARNPKCDINQEGVIAIDFGTKSTIVVYQSDIEHTLPMGIGDGNLSKEPTPKRYENPTVMEFVNLQHFLEAYRAKAGRPDTVWEDLPISHTAVDKFQNSKSEDYYAFLHQIKQWAIQRERQFRIKPIEGETLVLPAFLDLTDEDVNPIEIYAYYIGLYINNMRKGHGIFLDYYLAFPVSYEQAVRQKIIESFEKGLKKSLPVCIQKDAEIMKQFKVHGDISEPAAYAVCALQEYGLEPEENEEIFYGIFDFGGGTTDFDFGLWKQSSKRRYDYCIENFGADGDKYLGGENLLEMLAFEVFKENQDIMREENFTFSLAPNAKEFVGSDALLSDSQEAEKNMHNLMEVLRPYWENSKKLSEEYDAEKIGNEIEEIRRKVLDIGKSVKELDSFEHELQSIVKIYDDNLESMLYAVRELAWNYGLEIEKEDTPLVLNVSLFDKEGNDHPNVALKTSIQFIKQFFEEKIREGVDNFFHALMLSYQNGKVQKPKQMNILLAGNSCKSPLVKKIFEEKIKETEAELCKQEHVEPGVKYFEIFPPLGTKEAYEKMKERNIPYCEDDFEKPTGKTGVAFGLIQCRAGGNIERIEQSNENREIPFQYFLGWNKRKKFLLFKDETKTTLQIGKPDYEKWYQFIEADTEIFYLYYTSLPECVSGDLMIEGNPAVKRIKCNIDVVDENANVYIRAKGPHTLEYVVATDYDVENHKLGKIFTKELK